MTKPVWSQVLASSAKIIADCIRYTVLLVSFAINLYHRRTFLLYVNTLACTSQNHSSVTMFINYVYDCWKNIFA